MPKDLRYFIRQIEEHYPDEILRIEKEVDPKFELSAVMHKVQHPRPSRFSRSSISRRRSLRHKPTTTRKNIGAAYHGCLAIRVSRSTEFGRQIAGWFEGLVRHLPASPVAPSSDVVDHMGRRGLSTNSGVV